MPVIADLYLQIAWLSTSDGEVRVVAVVEPSLLAIDVSGLADGMATVRLVAFTFCMS